MFELPEYATLARQLADTVAGKRVREGRLGNSPHKFVWYNRRPDEFEALVADRRLGEAHSRGRWLFLPANPGYVLVFGECGGRILYHPDASEAPQKYHLLIRFDDGSALSALTQMWGAMELYENGEELNRQYVRDMRPTPADREFTFDYFSALIDECVETQKRSVKGLLTQDQLIPGLGNSIAQDIMFEAKLHPKRPLAELAPGERRGLFDSILRVVAEVTAKGGRSDEIDLFNRPGGYERILSKDTVGKPCRVCGRAIAKMQYLGGTCYYCPRCQG